MNERDLFMAVLPIEDAAERSAYLDRACAGQTALRQRVEALLAAFEQAGSFLQPPAGDPRAKYGVSGLEPTSGGERAEGPGAVIGPYKLIEQIGQGGMGTVWMAQQIEPVKRVVALKLIKAGMDSKQIIARFEAERQALALMDHPNIARVLDGGTTAAGRPYFVMDLVKGVPITRYCDEHHLTPRQRLELFVPVCQAVQHAHQKGIIHRDLKPSNVLVALYDGRPAPKVIDFGVAKAAGQSLTGKTLVTGFGALVGTLEYMSPEQAEINQLDIDTRSDIYSLGVLLYELLTGSPPFTRKELEKAGMLEMLRVIREEEPSKPSTKLSSSEALPTLAANRGAEPARLTKLLRGELDWIVMKALEKDRNRRYETANGFAQDVQRYLADEPVLACPPSVAYRLRKFARRNKQAMTSVGAVAVALLLVVGAFGWTLRDSAARRQAAAKEEAHRLAKLTEEIGRALNEVENALKRDRLPEAVTGVVQAERLLASGEASEEQRRQVRQWRTELDLAARLEEIRLPYLAGSLERESAAPGFADVFQNYGFEPGKFDAQSVAERIRASRVKDWLVAGLHDWARWQRTQDQSGWKELLALANRVDPDPWREQLREVMKTQDRETLKQLAENPDALARSPDTALLLAMSFPGDQAELAVEVLAKVQREHPDNIWINTNLGHYLLLMKPPRRDEAIGFYRSAVALRPQSAEARLNLGQALELQQQWSEAEAEYREAIRLKPEYATAHARLGQVLRAVGRIDEAEAAFRAALRIDPNIGPAKRNLINLLSNLGRVAELEEPCQEAVRRNPNDPLAYFWLGAVLKEQRKYEEAVDALQEGLRLDPQDSSLYASLGHTRLAQQRLPEAEAAFREAVRLRPNDPESHRLLAISLFNQANFAEAEAAWREFLQIMPDNADGQGELAQAIFWQGKYAEAEKAYREALRLAPDQGWIHYQLGLVLSKQRMRDDAEQEFRHAVRLNPKHSAAYQALGNCLLAKGEWEEAITEFRDAIALDPNFDAAHLSLANALRTKGDLNEAIAAYRQAISLRPNYATAYFELARALKRQGDAAGTIAAYRKALELDSNDANLWRHLELAWELGTCPDPQLREPAEALTLAQKAWDRSPGRVDIPKVLGVAHYRTGDWKSAVDVLEKAVHTNARFFLAMAHWQLGEKEQARECYDRAVKWLAAQEQSAQIQEESRRFQAEAAQLLELKNSDDSR
jgi:tetratricopeptide (TPR) repeat protein/serine/threonine protein kinase